MEKKMICGIPLEKYRTDTVLFGTGAAGLCCAKRLADLGQNDLILLTNSLKMGTSRNTGSDKQTYYKLNLSGKTPDSVYEVARTLFDGEAVDGDIALTEAALSARCFYHLADLGVRFVQNEYGEFVGYKTDHDPKARAASAGPLTVQEMCSALFAAVQRQGIRVEEGLTPLKILKQNGKAAGLLCFWRSADRRKSAFRLYHANHVVMATGAPASLYEMSVFPESQIGASGVCFLAGAQGKNLTEWQYGLASTNFRWNVSGSYQQVLPRYVSTLPDGSDEREFLTDWFADEKQALAAVFLKGYQWPFDATKLQPGGSSFVDIAVYHEMVEKGRRVFLDYRKNPFGHHRLDEENLSEECYHYLSASGALQETPFERLQALNPAAIKLYANHGIDLQKEMLPVAVCAQHNNGGLAGNFWWETDLPGLFAIGELNGSHGVRRPGGSALNAGQVGAFRAAEKIAFRAGRPVSPEETEEIDKQVDEIRQLVKQFLSSGGNPPESYKQYVAERNSRYAGFIRNPAELERSIAECSELLAHPERIAATPETLTEAFNLWDMLLCTKVYTEAMLDYIRHGGRSRGSALIAQQLPRPGDAVAVETALGGMIQQTKLDEQTLAVTCSWRAVRPLPDSPQWFEQVWREMKEGKGR